MLFTSVIIPTYNAERTIDAAIRSILTQSNQPFEIIVVDDGSSDGTAAAVAAIVDSRIRLLHQQNRGPGAARNRGISESASEIIALLDADDLALPDRLALQVSMLAADPALAVVGGGYLWIDEAGHELPWPYHSWRHFPELNELGTWLLDCPFVPSATVFRRSAWEQVGGFDESLRGPEDWDFWMRLVLARQRMSWCREVVCGYRRTGTSLSTQARRMSQDSVRVLRQILGRPDFPASLAPIANHALAIRHLDGAKRMYWSDDHETARLAVERALNLDPSLCAGRPSYVEDLLVSAALDPLVEDPVAFLSGVLDNLPEGAVPAPERRRALLARCSAEILVRRIQHGDYRDAGRHLSRSLARYPAWPLTPELWRISWRAVRNRFAGPAARAESQRPPARPG